MSGKFRPPNQQQNLLHQHYQSWTTGNGSQTEFGLPRSVQRPDDVLVFVGGVLQRPYANGTAFDYRIRGLSDVLSYPGDSNKVKFSGAPGNGVSICFYTAGG